MGLEPHISYTLLQHYTPVKTYKSLGCTNVKAPDSAIHTA